MGWGRRQEWQAIKQYGCALLGSEGLGWKENGESAEPEDDFLDLGPFDSGTGKAAY